MNHRDASDAVKRILSRVPQGEFESALSEARLVWQFIAEQEIRDEDASVEREYLAKHGPVRHAQTAHLIDLHVEMSDRVHARVERLTGRSCSCDERACPEHRRGAEAVNRYARIHGLRK